MGIFSGRDGGSPQGQVDRADLDDLRARVTRLEATVARLQQQPVAPNAGPTADPSADQPWLTDVSRLAAGEDKIAAIKLYREQTGVGLREAKDYVDGLG